MAIPVLAVRPVQGWPPAGLESDWGWTEPKIHFPKTITIFDTFCVTVIHFVSGTFRVTFYTLVRFIRSCGMPRPPILHVLWTATPMSVGVGCWHMRRLSVDTKFIL
jgi:hypothetical protein